MRNRLHYAWIVALVTFAVLLVTAGIRATPAVLMISLEGEFGWSRTVISAAVAINIALFGLIGPFAASVMDRWDLRRVVLGAVVLLAVSVALTTRMQNEWQFTLLWGVLVGTGTGVTSMVLAAIVASRWFDERRGLVLGVLSAANATGQPVFLPLARVAGRHAGMARRRAAGGRRRRCCVRHRLLLHARRPRGPRVDAVRPSAHRRGCVARARHGAGRGAAPRPPFTSLLAFGWSVLRLRRKHEWAHRIGASHQLGASMAALGAGAIRTMLGDYQLAFWIAGLLCVLAGLSFLTIGRRSFVPPGWVGQPSTSLTAPVAVRS